MALIEIKKDPSQKELSWFGAIATVFLGCVGAILFWRFHNPNGAYGVWTVAAVFFIVYYAIPFARKPAYLAWMHATYPIGWCVSHLLLAAVFYFLMTPIGLILRILGHDSMRKIDDAASSYWIERDNTSDDSHYFRQF